MRMHGIAAGATDIVKILKPISLISVFINKQTTYPHLKLITSHLELHHPITLKQWGHDFKITVSTLHDRYLP